MIVWGVVGRKDMGKTTLVAALVREMGRRGLSVSTLKHTHHAIDLEVEGTDTHRHREAGARQVVLASSARITVMEERGGAVSVLDALTRLAPCDVVLAEGWKAGPHRRVEVWRAGGKPPLAAEDPTIAAVATDAPCDVACPVLDLNDVAGLADWMLR